MNIHLTPEQERIVKRELETGHSRTVEEVIEKALLALSESSVKNGGDAKQREAVREMASFVEKNRVRLDGITVRDLVHEGHELRAI